METPSRVKTNNSLANIATEKQPVSKMTPCVYQGNFPDGLDDDQMLFLCLRCQTA